MFLFQAWCYNLGRRKSPCSQVVLPHPREKETASDCMLSKAKVIERWYFKRGVQRRPLLVQDLK